MCVNRDRCAHSFVPVPNVRKQIAFEKKENWPKQRKHTINKCFTYKIRPVLSIDLKLQRKRMKKKRTKTGSLKKNTLPSKLLLPFGIMDTMHIQWQKRVFWEAKTSSYNSTRGHTHATNKNVWFVFAFFSRPLPFIRTSNISVCESFPLK